MLLLMLLMRMVMLMLMLLRIADNVYADDRLDVTAGC